MDAPRDNNFIPAALFEIDGQSGEVMPGQIDEATGRILVDSASGSGTVTSVSVATANGFAGTVANATTTAVITLTVTTSGILKGDGTSISAAVAGTDYLTATSTNTLTNKTFDTAGSGNSFSINSTAVTNTTGTGAVVLKQAPSINGGTLVETTLTSPKLNENVILNTTATRLNYLESVAGSTGTNNSNVVFSGAPTFTGNTTFTKLTGDTVSAVYVQATTNNSVKITSGTYQDIQSYSPSAASVASLDLSLGNIHRVQMPAGNVTLQYMNQKVGKIFQVDIIQDSVGGRTVTWPTTTKWPSGAAVTLSSTSNHIDTVVVFIQATSTFQNYIAGQDLY